LKGSPEAFRLCTDKSGRVSGAASNTPGSKEESAAADGQRAQCQDKIHPAQMGAAPTPKDDKSHYPVSKQAPPPAP